MKTRDGIGIKNKRMFVCASLSLIIFLLSISSIPASAIAIAGRISFDPVVIAGSSVTQEAIVMNDEPREMKYNITVYDNYSDWISFSPNDFTLPAFEGRNVGAKFNITVSPPVGTEPGNYTTRIRIVSSPSSAGNFSVGAGVLLPVRIEVKRGPTLPEKLTEAGKGLIDRIKELGPMGVMMVMILILVLVVIVMGLKLRRKGKEGGGEENK